jgi:hypothetical protein
VLFRTCLQPLPVTPRDPLSLRGREDTCGRQIRDRSGEGRKASRGRTQQIIGCLSKVGFWHRTLKQTIYNIAKTLSTLLRQMLVLEKILEIYTL